MYALAMITEEPVRIDYDYDNLPVFPHDMQRAWEGWSAKGLRPA